MPDTLVVSKNAGGRAARPWQLRITWVTSTKNTPVPPGIFASREVTDMTEKQIMIAAGEGTRAALSTCSWRVENTPMP